MSKFLIISLIILATVVASVYYLTNKNPEKAEENQKNIEDQVAKSSLIPGETSPAADTVKGEATASTNNEPKQWEAAPVVTVDTSKTYTATIKTTSGDMAFELFVSETPITVNNFVFLANNDFYNGTKFHRIIKDFMIQGGDPLGNGTGDPGYKFNDEKVTRDYVRGTLAMANSGVNTNGSQFFIMTKDTPLPKNYTIFGKLVSGDNVLQRIAETPVTTSPMGEVSQPTEKVLITNVTINVK